MGIKFGRHDWLSSHVLPFYCEGVVPIVLFAAVQELLSETPRCLVGCPRNGLESTTAIDKFIIQTAIFVQTAVSSLVLLLLNSHRFTFYLTQ